MSTATPTAPEWARGDPPATVLRGPARAAPLELPDLSVPPARPIAGGAPDTGALRTPTWTTGYRDGHAEGYEAGRLEGLARGEQEAVARAGRDAGLAVTALRAELAEVRRREQERLEALTREAVTLALDVAAAVIGHHVAASTDPGAEALARALAATELGGPATARLHPDDLDRLSPEARAADPHLELVADASVGPGGCVLETGGTRVDATVEAAMTRVRTVLGPPQAGDPGGVDR